MPRRLHIVEAPKDLAIKAFHVCTHTGRIVAIFPTPIEFSEAMGLADAREHAVMLVKAACLHEAIKLALMHFDNGSPNEAIRTLQDALNEEIE